MRTHIHPHSRVSFLSQKQQRLLSSVLDLIIPNTDVLPGAGELGVAEHVEGVSGTTQHNRRRLSEGLKAIDVNSFMIYAREFDDLSDEKKTCLLKQVESKLPDFFQLLIQETYAGYYTNFKILKAKGLRPQAPQPEGFKLDEFDLSLLDNVRKRAKFYRDD